MIDNMLAGSTDIDHARHVQDFTDRLKVIVTMKTLLGNALIIGLADVLTGGRIRCAVSPPAFVAYLAFVFHKI